MKLVSSITTGMGVLIMLTFVPWAAQSGQVSLPPEETPSGYIALLLINEVPFPGDTAYVSERNSKHAMVEILAVLENRLHAIPRPYTQREVAGIRTRNILDIITAGGVAGQVQGFYKNDRGQYVVVPRVIRRVEYLLTIANQGARGIFARLIDFAVSTADDYLSRRSTVDDLFASIHRIRRVPVTGRAYAWMTNLHHINPGGDFIVIPPDEQGTLGGNRFFTLRKHNE